jgi:hypothetical protein
MNATYWRTRNIYLFILLSVCAYIYTNRKLRELGGGGRERGRENDFMIRKYKNYFY